MRKSIYQTIKITTEDSLETLNEINRNKEAYPKGRAVTVGSLIERIKDLAEFEERLLEFLDQVKNLFFGINYEVGTSKTLKRDLSPESLVNALLLYEKPLKKNAVLPSDKIEAYQFLKLALEKDATLLNQDDYLLGVRRNRSGLYLPQKNIIVIQCAAQVLWHLEGIQIPTIVAMKDKLCDPKLPYFELLEINRFNNPRTITNWISAVFPVPPKARKQHGSKNIKLFNDVRCIPDIFTEKGMSFPKLRFALITITRVLKALNWEQSEIIKTRPITFLADQLKFYPSQYVIDWINEAYLSNGSIFDS